MGLHHKRKEYVQGRGSPHIFSSYTSFVFGNMLASNASNAERLGAMSSVDL